MQDDRPRRKLLIIGPLPPPYSGPEIGTATLVDSPVLNSAYEVRSLNTTVRTSNAEKGRIDATMFTAYLKYLYRLLRQLLVFRPDLILYCPTSASLIGWVRDGTTLLLGPLFAGRVVLQFRGGHFRYFFQNLAPLAQRLVGFALARSALVLAQADVLKGQFRGLLPDSRIGRLYNAVPQDFFAHFEGLVRPAAPAEITVLFVGHLSHAKGYCEVLKVIARLCGRHRIRFRFMGALLATERNVFFNQATGERLVAEDPTACFQAHVARHGLEGQVEFLGSSVFGEDKLRAFSSADIFVLPSYSEGFSRAILESMAAGLPAVVTAVGAVPEIITDRVDGLVIAPGDTAALYARLDELAANGAMRARIGRCARERCRQLFMPDRLAESLIAQLEAL